MAKGRNKQRNFDNITIDQLIKQEPEIDSLPEQNTSELQTIDPYKVNNAPAVKQPLILEAVAPHRVNNIAPTISALTGENPDEKQVAKEVADKEIQYLDNLNALKQVLDNNELSKFNKVMLPGGERTVGEPALGTLVPSNPDVKISPDKLEEINKIYQMNKEAEKPKNYKGLKEYQKDLDRIEYLDKKYSAEGTEYDPEDEKELKNLINKRNTLVGIHNNLTFGEKEDYKLFNAQKKINELKNKPNFDKDLSNVGGHIYSGVLNALNMTVGADYQGEIKSDIRKDETNKNIENEYKEVTEPKTLFGKVVQGLATTAALAPMFAFGFNAGGVKVGAGYLKNLASAAKGSALVFAPGGASKGIQKTVAEVKNRESKGEQLDTFDRIWIGTKNIGGEVLKNTMEGVSEMMIPGFNPGKTFLKSILVNAPLNIITETATEQVSDITGDLVDGTNTSLLVSLLRTGKFSEESINQVLVEAIIGGIYGSAVGGGQFWAGHLQENLDKKDYATLEKYIQENKPTLEKNLGNVIDKTVSNTKEEVSGKIKNTESTDIEDKNNKFNINPEQVDPETGFTNFPELKEDNEDILTSDPKGLFVVANLERGLEDDFKRKRRIIDEKIVTSQLDNVVGKREIKRLENLYNNVLEHNKIAKELINGKSIDKTVETKPIEDIIGEETPQGVSPQESDVSTIPQENVQEDVVPEEDINTAIQTEAKQAVATKEEIEEKNLVDDVEKKVNELFKSDELISEDIITSTLDNVRSESEIARLLELYDKVGDHNNSVKQLATQEIKPITEDTPTVAEEPEPITTEEETIASGDDQIKIGDKIGDNEIAVKIIGDEVYVEKEDGDYTITGIYSKDDFLKSKDVYEKNIIYKKKQDEAQKKIDLEKTEKEKEYNNLYGFENNKSALELGRAKKILNEIQFSDGKLIAKKDIIINRIKNGYNTLNSDNTILGKKNDIGHVVGYKLNKTEGNFAKHYLDSNPQFGNIEVKNTEQKLSDLSQGQKPYQMTSTEYKNTFPTNAQEATFAKARHEQEVLSAYMKGLAIPPKVLAEYPNLKENAEKLRKENAEYEKKKTAKESKNVSERQKQKRAKDVVLTNLNDINKDEKRFQNRKSLNKKKVENTVNNYNESEFDPIHLWRDKDNKLYLLSGHHRLEAAKQLGLDEVKSIIRTDLDEKGAIDYAINRSNTNRSMETPIERAQIYRKLRDEGASENEIQKKLKETEDKNSTKINNLSHLNPSGKTIIALSQMGDNVAGADILNNVADYIGEAKKRNPNLTDEHEDEMFAYLVENGQIDKFNSKLKFLDKIDLFTESPEFNQSRPLGLNGFNTVRGQRTIEIDEALTEARKERKQLEDQRKRFEEGKLQAPDGKTAETFLAELTNGIFEANKKIIDLTEERRGSVEMDKSQTDLFAQLEDNKEQLKDEEIDEKVSNEIIDTADVAELEQLAKDIESITEIEDETEINNAIEKSEKLILGEAPQEAEGAISDWVLVPNIQQRQLFPKKLLSLVKDHPLFIGVKEIYTQPVKTEGTKKYLQLRMQLKKDIPENRQLFIDRFKGGELAERFTNIQFADEVIKGSTEDNLKQSLIDRTELQQLQDRKRHLNLVIEKLSEINSDNEKVSKYYNTYGKSPARAIMEAKQEISGINKKLAKIEAKESQWDIFGDAQDQISLFRKEADRTRTVYNKMSTEERERFNKIVANSFLQDNPDTGFTNLSKDKAQGITYLIAQAMRFDPRVADITTAMHEATHMALSNMVAPSEAQKILRDNGWDGKGDYRETSKNKSLTDAYEKIAKASEKWILAKEPKTFTEKFVAMFKNLLNKLAAFMYNQGFYTQAGFFENLYTGKLREMSLNELSQRVNDLVTESTLAQKKSITETENFKKWFGDSKVVDENGNPLVVYHGTGNKFNIFDITKGGSVTKSKTGRMGFWFSNKDVAKGYGEFARTKPVQDLIDASLKAERQGKWDLAEELSSKAEKLEQQPEKKPIMMPVYLNMENPFIYDAESQKFIDLEEEFNSIITNAKNNGHDGVIFKDLDDNADWGSGRIADHYIVFNPTQIKSAIGNNGNFDVNNPNILKQEIDTEAQKENEESINEYGKYIFENGKNKYADWLKQMRNIYGENKSYATQFAKLLRNSIKSKTVSVENESIPKEDKKVVDDIGEDTENRGKFVRMRERTFILEKIKQYKKGYREGRSDTKKELEFLKNEIATYARQHLPKTLEKYKITPLLTAIAKATKIEHVEYSLKRIDEYVDKSIKNSLITKILKKLETYKPKKENSVLKGKNLTADEYKILDDIRNIIKMPRYQVADMRTRILSQVENTGKELSDEMDENFYRLNLFSDLSNKTAEELQQALDEVNEIINDGRSKRQKEREAYKQKIDALITTILKEITRGGRGILTEQEIKKAGEDDRRFYNFMTYIHNLESIFDAITFDKTKNMYQGTLNKQFIPQIKEGHRLQYAWENEVITQVRDKLMEIYGINEADNSSYRARKKLNKAITANREEIENTGVTYINPRTGVREELTLSQNTAAKKWMESQMDNLAETFKAMGWDEQTFDELDKFIKPQVKRWARYQIEVLYPELAKKVNAKYKSYFGINMPISENYNPISRKYNGVDSNENSPLTGSSSHLATVINNHLKATTKNTRPLEFTDMDSVLGEYVVQMAHFVAFADVVKEMRGVIQNEAIQNAIEQEVGGMYKSTINQHIEDIARGGTNSKFMIRWLEKRLNNFVPAVLAINPSIFLKQLSSLFAYSAEIPRDEFLKGVADYIANPAKVVKFLSETDAWKLRYGKGFERDLIAWNKKNTPNTFAGQKTLKDALMIMISLGDKGSVTAGGWSVYKYYYEKSIKEGKSIKEAEKIAETEFQTITGRTQQSGETEDLSTLQKLGTFGKIVTLFMTQPVSYFRQEWGAARNIARGRGKLSDNLYKVAMYHVVLPSFFQYVASGFPGLFSNWDDEDERRMARAATVGSFNGLFIVGNILESIMGTIYGSRFFDSGQVPLQQIPESVSKTIYKLTKIVDERRYLDMDIRDFLEVVDAVFMTVDKLVGVPYYTGKRIVQGVRDLVEGEGAPMKALGYSDFSLGEDSKNRITPETIGWNIRKKVADEIMPLLKAKKYTEARSKLKELQDKIMPVLIEDINYKSEKNLNKLKRQVKPLIEQGETIEANKQLRILQQKINRDKASAAEKSKNLYYFGSLVNQRLTDEEDGQYKELFKNWRLNQYRGVSPSLLKKYPD